MDSKQEVNEAYKLGWYHAMENYAVWRDGKQYVGFIEVPLDSAKGRVEQLFLFSPPSRNS